MWTKFVLGVSRPVLDSGKTVIASVLLSGEALLPQLSMGRSRQSVADMIILGTNCSYRQRLQKHQNESSWAPAYPGVALACTASPPAEGSSQGLCFHLYLLKPVLQALPLFLGLPLTLPWRREAGS